MSEKTQPPIPAGQLINGDLGQIAGQSWTRVIFWLVVLAAGGVDIASFYQVLVLVLNAPDDVVWAAVVGFVAVGLALAHHAGLQIRQAVDPRNVTGSAILAWVLGGVWLLLGLVAFVVRYIITQPLGSDTSSFIVNGTAQTTGSGLDTTSQHATALLFLVFYIATGTVTAAGGYLRQDPDARHFGRAVGQRSTAVRRHAETVKRFGRVLQADEALAGARARHEEAWATAQEQCMAAAQRLKREVRLYIASHVSPTAAPSTEPLTLSPAGEQPSIALETPPSSNEETAS